MSSGVRSPSAVERAAASSRSPGVRQPFRRRITYVFTMPSSVVVFVDPRSAHAAAHRENDRGWAAALRGFQDAEPAGGGHRLAPRAGVELPKQRRYVVVDRARRGEGALGA